MIKIENIINIHVEFSTPPSRNCRLLYFPEVDRSLDTLVLK
jgi:hypothetical protein